MYQMILIRQFHPYHCIKIILELPKLVSLAQYLRGDRKIMYVAECPELRKIPTRTSF